MKCAKQEKSYLSIDIRNKNQYNLSGEPAYMSFSNNSNNKNVIIEEFNKVQSHNKLKEFKSMNLNLTPNK